MLEPSGHCFLGVQAPRWLRLQRPCSSLLCFSWGTTLSPSNCFMNVPSGSTRVFSKNWPSMPGQGPGQQDCCTIGCSHGKHPDTSRHAELDNITFTHITPCHALSMRLPPAPSTVHAAPFESPIHSLCENDIGSQSDATKSKAGHRPRVAGGPEQCPRPVLQQRPSEPTERTAAGVPHRLRSFFFRTCIGCAQTSGLLGGLP